jgi:signal transduction histidine kinase
VVRHGAARACFALAIGIAVGSRSCRTDGTPGRPVIVFDHVPPAEPGGASRLVDVDGRVVAPGSGRRLVLYARSGDWYVQPFADAPFTEIRPNASWSSRTHLGTEYAALLVEPGYRPPAITAVLPGPGGGVVAVEVAEGTPPFWRRRSFLAFLAMPIAAVGMALHLVRVRTLTRQLHLRAEERLAERTRIAQSLYDTLLQGFLGASLQLHMAVEDLPADSPHRARLGTALARIGEVAEEGRKVLQGLRGASPDAEPLDAALRRFDRESAEAGTRFRVSVAGAARPLHPIVREEVYCVCREALLNAFRHARAKAVEVEIEYSPRDLRIAVRDDGGGFASYPDAHARGGGLCTMQARADAIGARLKVRSRPGAGTVVDLSVPGAVAYTAEPPAGK